MKLRIIALTGLMLLVINNVATLSASASTKTKSGTSIPNQNTNLFSGTFATDLGDGGGLIPQVVPPMGTWITNNESASATEVGAYSLDISDICQQATLESLEVNFLVSAPDSIDRDTLFFSHVLDKNATLDSRTARPVTVVTNGGIFTGPEDHYNMVGYSNEHPEWWGSGALSPGATNLPVSYTVSLDGLTGADISGIHISVTHIRGQREHTSSSTQPSYNLTYDDTNCPKLPTNQTKPNYSGTVAPKTGKTPKSAYIIALGTLNFVLIGVVIALLIIYRYPQQNKSAKVRHPKEPRDL